MQTTHCFNICFVLVLSLLLPEIQGFVTHTTGATPWAHAVTNLETKIHMGFFDGITKAFSNEEVRFISL